MLKTHINYLILSGIELFPLYFYYSILNIEV